MNQQRADEILRRASERFIVVYGDVMLDEFVWGDVTRISPEGPVPVVDVRRESVHLGGAANVLANLTALGVRASVVGVVGHDRAGERLRAELKEAGPSADALVLDETRPTTTKTRIIAHSQLVVRADREQRTPVDAKTEERIIEVLNRAITEADAFVISDYDKGAVTPRVLSEVLPAAKARGIPVLIDPKIRNFDSYSPATLVTPNHHEALRLTNTEEHDDESLKRAAHLIRARLDCESVLITRGERGMMLLESYHEPVYVETAAREVYDVTGAGDTVIATLAAALSAEASMLEAAILANHAAGIVVGKVGTATASAEEVVNSIQREDR
ncbi:MAG: D-glycero-beta-D-manno-heptose-7-phosphate kinase [Acidobacteriota bacterium]|nr:D-glycero-beta-D-manno-heptose-7-phosphate kinase [Acidobacteriota bacterium]